MKKIILLVLGVLLIGGGWWLINVTGILNTNNLSNRNPNLVWVNKKGVLKIGVDTNFYPMEFLDEKGKVVGFGPDLAKEIAKNFKVPVEIVSVPFTQIFKDLDEEKIDMIISSISITPERSKSMSFSKPYFNAGQIILVRKDNNSIKDLHSLRGKKIAVGQGTTSEIEAYKYTEKEKVMVFGDDTDIQTLKLLKGEVEAIIIDYPVAAGIVKDNPTLKMVGMPFTQELYGVVVAKNREGLLVPVNKTIEKLIKSGEMKKLEEKWLK